MYINILNEKIIEFKKDLENSIRTKSYSGKEYEDGQKAKEALIRSQNLILKVHEAVKKSLILKLEKQNILYHGIFPPLNSSNPELKITGLIKAKDQDIVLLFKKPKEEIINIGPLDGEVDFIGKQTSETAIVIGVRSQMSSIEKNFDTLMERSFAETLNLRLRMPKLVMGEVYLIPTFEYDDEGMKNNKVKFKSKPTNIKKFIKTFNAISNRSSHTDQNELYKYERTALLLVDFRNENPKIYLSNEELISDGLISKKDEIDYKSLGPQNFVDDLVNCYKERFS